MGGAMRESVVGERGIRGRSGSGWEGRVAVVEDEAAGEDEDAGADADAPACARRNAGVIIGMVRQEDE